MGLEKPRELLDLVIREVSLVDRAANLRKFVVVKRTEEAAMGNFQKDSRTETGKTGVPETDVVQKAFPPEVMSAIKATAEWLKQKSGEQGAPPEAAVLAAFMGKVAAGGYPAPGGYPYPSPEQARKASDKNEEDEEMKKAKKKVEDDDLEKARKKKELEDEVEKAKKKVVDEEDIEKSSKRFTKGRVKDIQESMIKLLSMLKGVDEAALSEALQKAFPKEDEEEKANVKKEETFKREDVEAVQKAIDEVNRRVEAIEKTRNPPQSGASDTTTSVQKSTGSFWRGIL